MAWAWQRASSSQGQAQACTLAVLTRASCSPKIFLCDASLSATQCARCPLSGLASIQLTTCVSALSFTMAMWPFSVSIGSATIGHAAVYRAVYL